MELETTVLGRLLDLDRGTWRDVEDRSGAVYSGETRSVPEESSTPSTHREDESPPTEAKSKAYNCLAEGSTSEPRKRDLEHGSECVSPRSGVRETSWECPITMDYVRELWRSLGGSSEGATSPARSSSPVIDPEPDESCPYHVDRQRRLYDGGRTFSCWNEYQYELSRDGGYSNDYPDDSYDTVSEHSTAVDPPPVGDNSKPYSIGYGPGSDGESQQDQCGRHGSNGDSLPDSQARTNDSGSNEHDSTGSSELWQRTSGRDSLPVLSCESLPRVRDPKAKLLFTVPPEWSDSALKCCLRTDRECPAAATSVSRDVGLRPSVLLANTSISNSFLQPLCTINCYDELPGSEQHTESVDPWSTASHNGVASQVHCYKVDCFLAHGDVLEHENASLSASDSKDIEKKHGRAFECQGSKR